MRITLVILLACLTGCYTYRDKVAHKRAELTLKTIGAEDALAAAVGIECEQANIDSGAADIPADAVVLTVEASQENTAAIIAERESRGRIWSAVKALGGKLVEKLPWVGPVVGFLAAAFEFFRRKKAVLASKKAGEIVGVLGRYIGKDGEIDVSHLADEAKGFVTINADDVKSAVEDAKRGEI